MTRAGRAALQRALKSPRIRRALIVALRDEENLGWVVHHLSDRMAIGEASFQEDFPPGLQRVEGFEDLYWLFTSTPITHRLSRLQLDEASFLYRLVHGLERPRVAELGRFKGGTTFLLAAAGGRVLSIDFAEEAQARYLPPLEEFATASSTWSRRPVRRSASRTYAASAQSFDVVFADADFSYEGMRADVEHWLPAIRPGGHLIVRMISRGTPPYAYLKARATPVFRFVEELDRRDGLTRADAPPSLAHYVTGLSGPLDPRGSMTR